LAGRHLVNLVRLVTRHDLANGSPNAAVDNLLAAAWFGADHSRNSVLMVEMIGCALLSIALEEMAPERLGPRLDTTTRRRLTAGLALLYDNLPARQVWRYERLLLGVNLVTLSAAEAWHHKSNLALLPSSWRYGFSYRMMICDWWASGAEFLRAFEQCRQQPWASAQPELQRLHQELRSHPNPVLRLSGWHEIETTLRLVDAQLAVTVAGWHRLAHGEVPELRDPFGTTLRSATRPDGTVAIWSLGQNGVDDGGSGAWRGDPDLVLELTAPRIGAGPGR
jgi:hypothetical protein